jgi:hypothetical protein
LAAARLHRTLDGGRALELGLTHESTPQLRIPRVELAMVMLMFTASGGWRRGWDRELASRVIYEIQRRRDWNRAIAIERARPGGESQSGQSSDTAKSSDTIGTFAH